MARYHTADAVVSAWKAATVVKDTPFEVCRALYIGATGDLTVTMADGATQAFVAVPVGIFPIQCTNVAAASTADSIVALY